MLTGEANACYIFVAAFILTIWHQIADNQWIYQLSAPDKLRVVDLNDLSSQYELTSSGFITLPSGFSGYTNSRILHSGKTNSTHLIGMLDMPDIPIVTNLSAPTPGYRLKHLSVLDSMQLEMARKEYEAFVSNNTMSYHYDRTEERMSSSVNLAQSSDQFRLPMLSLAW